jgi:hypothetical protein
MTDNTTTVNTSKLVYIGPLYFPTYTKKEENTNLPRFRGMGFSLCSRQVSAEIELDSVVSFIPFVKLDSQSFGAEIRTYEPRKKKEDGRGFVTFRISSRSNASVGYGYTIPPFLAYKFGIYGNIRNVNRPVKPFFGIEIEV